jgi:urease
MRLSVRELDKLITYQAGSLAQRRLARGLQLNLSEATALIALQLQELIRDGTHSVSELMQIGKEILGRRHVLPGVSALMHDVQVEGTFPDGCDPSSTTLKRLSSKPLISFYRVFLVTVHDPICSDSLSLERALYGSFLPVPTDENFLLEAPETYSRKNAPGAVIVANEPIVLNGGRTKVSLRVTNKGDRPIQVELAFYPDRGRH